MFSLSLSRLTATSDRAVSAYPHAKNTTLACSVRFPTSYVNSLLVFLTLVVMESFLPFSMNLVAQALQEVISDRMWDRSIVPALCAAGMR
ncbi:MAG: hypothetical protein V1929_06935 [bacterium]